jgi:hypothetical protein
MSAMRFADPTLIPDSGKPMSAYVPPAVRIGRIPRWLASLVRRRDRPPFPRYRGWEVETIAAHGFVDHWGISKWQEQEVFVSEPYPLGLADLREVVAFCDRYELEVRVCAASSHYPTACLRLEFSPRGAPPGGGLGVIPLDNPVETT